MMDVKLLQPGEGNAVWVVGDRYTTLASGAETGGAYAMIAALVPPGGGPPLHLHRREDEAFYVLEGEVAFEADGKHFTAGSGSWIALPRGSRHRFQNVGRTPARLLILVNPAGLEKMFAEAGRAAVPGDEATPHPVTPEDIQRLLAIAPRYGVEILPPG
jgi:quercetin dioxygenase-like cupin family protein